MASTYFAVISLSLLSVFTTLAGVALALRVRESRRGIAGGIGFAAGIMLLISFLELIPEAAAEGGWCATLITAGLGALVLFSLHLAIPHTHLVKEENGIGAGTLKSAYLVVFGLILHDFPEGFAMAHSYVASPSLGILVAVAIALHNLPEEFAMAVPVVLLRRERFLYISAALSALAEPAGAIIGLVAVNLLPALNPLFMAFAAGAMIFVSLHELVPMARKYGSLRVFAAGMGVSGVVYLILNAMILHQ
jgi:ZIP family zinc transporter